MSPPRLAALAVVLLAFVAYGNSVFHGFVYDDDMTVTGCALIQSWGNAGAIFSGRYFTETIEMSWRPVCTVTYFADHWLFGDVAFGYHLSSVAWHALASLALFGLLRALTGGVWGAFAGAGLFAVHPLTSEAVNAISFREDILAALFAVLCVHLSARAGQGGARPWLLIAGACLALLAAGLSKESGAAAALLVALCAWHARGGVAPGWGGAGRGVWIALGLALAATLALWGALRFAVFVYADALPAPFWGGDRVTAVWNFPRIVFHGLRLALWPADLSADYEWRAIPAWHAAWLWMGWAGVAAIAALALTLRGRLAPVGFGAGWYLICLLPVSNAMALYNPVAERYFYLPLMGLSIAAGWAVERALAPGAGAERAPAARVRTTAALAGVAGCALLFGTVNRNLVWGDAERLWVATLEVEPRSTVALNNLGCIRIAQGRLDEAVTLLGRGISVNPQDTDLVFNYGVAQAQRGEWVEAQTAFEWFLTRQPLAAQGHWWLGQCLLHRPSPDFAAARRAVGEALRLGFRPAPDARASVEQLLATGDVS